MRLITALALYLTARVPVTAAPKTITATWSEVVLDDLDNNDENDEATQRCCEEVDSQLDHCVCSYNYSIMILAQ